MFLGLLQQRRQGLGHVGELRFVACSVRSRYRSSWSVSRSRSSCNAARASTASRARRERVSTGRRRGSRSAGRASMAWSSSWRTCTASSSSVDWYSAPFTDAMCWMYCTIERYSSSRSSFRSSTSFGLVHDAPRVGTAVYYPSTGCAYRAASFLGEIVRIAVFERRDGRAPGRCLDADLLDDHVADVRRTLRAPATTRRPRPDRAGTTSRSGCSTCGTDTPIATFGRRSSSSQRAEHVGVGREARGRPRRAASRPAPGSRRAGPRAGWRTTFGQRVEQVVAAEIGDHQPVLVERADESGRSAAGRDVAAGRRRRPSRAGRTATPR